jgi:ferredoxin-NADP reductase
MRLFKPIDNYLNGITTYTLMVYGLSALLGFAVIFSALGRLPIQFFSIIVTSAVILTVCFIADRLFPIIFNATSNKYSSLITALILCLILQPSILVHNLALVALASLIAVGSKYILVWHYKHIFNPAAIAAVFLGVTGLLPAIWWVGSPVMLIPTIVFGILVLRKIRRFQLFFSFLIASLIMAIIVGMRYNESLSYIFSTAFKSSPLIFLGTVMLTEPSTMPPKRWQQIIYGILVGALFTSEFRVGSVSATPELALVIGNIYTYMVSPKYKLKLKLKSKQKLTDNIYEFIFTNAGRLNFEAGQYMEWTLPKAKSDARGNRRTFSISSEPKSDEVRLVTKFAVKSSSFKENLAGLKSGDYIMAGQLAGDFTLPSDTSQKLVMIAGGIGIAPYVSMVKFMIKNKQPRNITLIYLAATEQEICYKDVWKKAEGLGLKFRPVIDGGMASARLNKAKLANLVPDYQDRRFYISGPNALVDNYAAMLRELNVSQNKIITDHFSGY